jgi:hypothetical protein
MGPLTPIIGLRLLALAARLRHNAEIGQPGLCFSAYGHKFGINHLDHLSGAGTRSTKVGLQCETRCETANPGEHEAARCAAVTSRT